MKKKRFEKRLIMVLVRTYFLECFRVFVCKFCRTYRQGLIQENLISPKKRRNSLELVYIGSGVATFLKHSLGCI